MRTGTEGRPTVFQSLAEQLRQTIRAGRYAPGHLLGSEHELAREHNISRMTVRKASELLVQEGLLERRPGKGLYVRGTPPVTAGTIQVIAGNLMWEPAIQMSRGIQEAAKADGSHVQLYDAHGDEDLDLTMMRMLPTSGSKGAVIISLHSAQFSQAICELHAKGYPFVLLDQRMRDIEVSAVTADNYGGGQAAGKLLIEAGHNRIGFIGDIAAATVQARLEGLRDAIGDAGLPFGRSLIFDLVVGTDRLGDWTSLINEGVEKLMKLPDRPTAIFCSCDAVARAAYGKLAALGLSIPKDISVVGFDGDPLGDYLTPRLTTFRQPFQEMGKTAMELLRHRIADVTAPAEFRSLPVELVRRDSVGPPRRG